VVDWGGFQDDRVGRGDFSKTPERSSDTAALLQSKQGEEGK
jgi:hypothetical protein